MVWRIWTILALIAVIGAWVLMVPLSPEPMSSSATNIGDYRAGGMVPQADGFAISGEVGHEVFEIPETDARHLEEAAAAMGGMEHMPGMPGMAMAPEGHGEAMPMAEGHGETKPMAGGHGEGTMPMAEGHGETMPMAEGHGEKTMPMTEGHGEAMPMAEGHGEETMPTAEGHGKAMPMAEGHGKAMPMAEGHGEKTMPMAEGHGEAMPMAEGHAKEAMPMAGAHGEAGGHGGGGMAAGISVMTLAKGMAMPHGMAAERTVEVTMSEWGYSPGHITVKPGEVIRLVVSNDGNLPHEFMLMGGAGMAAMRYRLERADWNLLEHEAIYERPVVMPGDSFEVVVQVHKPGMWMFMCMFPFHMQLGMMGVMMTEGMDMGDMKM